MAIVGPKAEGRVFALKGVIPEITTRLEALRPRRRQGTVLGVGRGSGSSPTGWHKVLAVVAAGCSYRLIDRELEFSKNRVAGIVKRDRDAKRQVATGISA